MTGIQKIIISGSKLSTSDPNFPSCQNNTKSNVCTELDLVPYMSLNRTIKNCMEDLFLYVVP